jgi:hypothetical protein
MIMRKTGLAQQVATDGHRVLDRMIASARWVGPGRELDKHGELPKAEVTEAAQVLKMPTPERPSRIVELPELDQVWSLCREFGLIELRRTRVVMGPEVTRAEQTTQGSAPAGQALQLWCDVCEELLSPSARPGQDKDHQRLREWIGRWGPQLLSLLYGRGPVAAAGVDLDELMDELIAQHVDALPSQDEELFTLVAGTAVRFVLADLDEHGAVEVSGTEEAEERLARAGIIPDKARALLGSKAWALLPGEGLRVRLTDLGRYYVHDQLVASGAKAPLRQIAVRHHR